MTPEAIVQIVTIVTTTLVTIVGLLVRSRIIGLERELGELRLVISSQEATINKLSNQITSLTATLANVRANKE